MEDLLDRTFALPPVAIHRIGGLDNPSKGLWAMVTPLAYLLRDEGEPIEVVSLDSQGVCSEERNDPLDELDGAVYRVHRHRVIDGLPSHRAATEEAVECVEDIDVVHML